MCDLPTALSEHPRLPSPGGRLNRAQRQWYNARKPCTLVLDRGWGCKLYVGGLDAATDQALLELLQVGAVIDCRGEAVDSTFWQRRGPREANLIHIIYQLINGGACHTELFAVTFAYVASPTRDDGF